MNKKYKIVIATGIYPPEIGGSAFYAEMLSGAFAEDGHKVSVVVYGFLKKLPTGIRHLFYALKLAPHILAADMVIALDTFSVAVPAVFVSRLFGKKIIVRAGGDFLWEEYIERTHENILLSEFYSEPRKFSKKENWIFKLTRLAFKFSSAVVFSTSWQKNIFLKAYGPKALKVSVIENVYAKQKQRNIVPKDRILLSPSRDIFLKNKAVLDKATGILKDRYPGVVLDTEVSSREELLERIFKAYCLLVPSLSEVSPNIVLDAISLGVPAVVTDDCGIKDRLGDTVVWVDPKIPESVAGGVASLMDAKIYGEYVSRISKFSYAHSPKEIVSEFLNIFENL